MTAIDRMLASTVNNVRRRTRSGSRGLIPMGSVSRA
jgi:hypothetical protein